MPPRKRKAQQALAAIDEEQQEQQLFRKEEVAEQEVGEVGDEHRVRSIIAECKEQVEAKATSLIDAARQRVQHLRTDAELAIIKLTKQVRQTSAADFFKLGPEEASASDLSCVLQRLKRLQQGGEGLEPGEAEAAGLVASSLAAAANARTSAVPPAAGQDNETRQHSTAAGAADGSGPSSSSAQAVTLMPPPPPRTALAPVNSARAPMQNEVVFSANGSPIYLNTMAASSAACGVNAKGAGPSIADATPAVGTCNAMAAQQPQTVAFTGHTFRRATAARGRTKQATRTITVTTEDGKAFTVDDVIGLAAVPDKYREEVRKMMESDLRDLDALYKSVATMEQANAAAATTTTGTARPTRRR